MKQTSQTGADQRITVMIDPDLEDIVPGFLENRRGDVKKLTDAQRSRDLQTIRALGHRMKGDGGGYGFDEISRIGSTLEQAALRQDWKVIGEQTAVLKTFLEQVHVVYQR